MAWVGLYKSKEGKRKYALIGKVSKKGKIKYEAGILS